jgi:hypothetical protein
MSILGNPEAPDHYTISQFFRAFAGSAVNINTRAASLCSQILAARPARAIPDLALRMFLKQRLFEECTSPSCIEGKPLGRGVRGEVAKEKIVAGLASDLGRHRRPSCRTREIPVTMGGQCGFCSCPALTPTTPYQPHHSTPSYNGNGQWKHPHQHHQQEQPPPTK